MIHPKNHHKCFARLACVKHAASVHPEPGSNSLKKFVQDQIFAWLNFIPFYLLWFCSLRTIFFWTFKDMSLFSYQGSLWFHSLSCDSFYILSQLLLFVNHFFHLFLKDSKVTIVWIVRAVQSISLATVSIIHHCRRIVNYFFQVFSTFYLQHSTTSSAHLTGWQQKSSSCWRSNSRISGFLKYRW